MHSQHRVALTREEVTKRVMHEILINGAINPLLTARDRSVKDLGKWIRLSKINSRRKDRSMATYSSVMRRECKEKNMPWHVTETASRIFTECVKHGVLRGHDARAMMMAAIYHACIVNNYPVTMKLLFKDMVERKFVYHAMTIVKEHVDMLYGKPAMPSTKRRNVTVASRFCDLIDRMGSEIGFENPRCVAVAKEIYTKIAESKERIIFIGKDPNTIIASLLLIAARATHTPVIVRDERMERRRQFVTLRIMSEKMSVTEVSIRTRARQIIETALGMEERDGVSIHPAIEGYVLAARKRSL